METGKAADLIMVRRDPLADIARMSDLSAVFKDDVSVDLDRLPAQRLVTKYPRDEDFKR